MTRYLDYLLEGPQVQRSHRGHPSLVVLATHPYQVVQEGSKWKEGKNRMKCIEISCSFSCCQCSEQAFLSPIILAVVWPSVSDFIPCIHIYCVCVVQFSHIAFKSSLAHHIPRYTPSLMSHSWLPAWDLSYSSDTTDPPCTPPITPHCMLPTIHVHM